MAQVSRRHTALVWMITAVYWAALFVATHLPPTRMPKTRVDLTMAHFAAYAVLAVLLLGSLRQIGVSPYTSPWWVVGICFIYGAIDEYSQIFVGRIGSFEDWYANAAGTVTVAGMAMVIGAYREARSL